MIPTAKREESLNIELSRQTHPSLKLRNSATRPNDRIPNWIGSLVYYAALTAQILLPVYDSATTRNGLRMRVLLDRPPSEVIDDPCFLVEAADRYKLP